MNTILANYIRYADDNYSKPVADICRKIITLYSDRGQMFIGYRFQPEDLDRMYKKGFEDGINSVSDSSRKEV